MLERLQTEVRGRTRARGCELRVSIGGTMYVMEKVKRREKKGGSPDKMKVSHAWG